MKGWLQCEVLRRRHSKEEHSIETLIRSSDHKKEIVLAQQEKDSRRHNLKGWTGYQNCKGRKPSKICELNCDMRSTRLSCKLHQVKDFIILSRNYIR